MGMEKAAQSHKDKPTIIEELHQLGIELGRLVRDSEELGLEMMEVLIERRTSNYLDALGISAGKVRDHARQNQIDINSDAYLSVILEHGREAVKAYNKLT